MPHSKKVNAESNSSHPLTVVQCISYTLPIVPMNMFIAPMAIIQGIYAKHYGLALTTLSGDCFALTRARCRFGSHSRGIFL